MTEDSKHPDEHPDDEESVAEESSADEERLEEDGSSAEDESAPAADPNPDPEPLEDRAARELNALRAVLRKTRRHVRTPSLVEGAAWFVATLGAVIVSAQFSGLLFGSIGPTVMRWVLLGGGAAAMLGGLVALGTFLANRPTLDDIARLLQRHTPDFRSDIVAALQFGERLTDPEDRGGWSTALALEHLRRTTRELLGRVGGDGALTDHLPQRSLTPALVAIGGCLLLLLAPYAVAPEKVQTLWTEAMSGVATDDGTPENRPIVGDIDLLYSFPPYADMQPRFEPFTTGHIETLVGSEVTLKTYPLIQASKYEMIVRTADGERLVALEQTRGQLRGTMLLTKAGSYMFRATLADGTVVEDGIERPIVLQPDQTPTVRITSHNGELEVSPDEVLELEYVVEDDFGIESVARGTQFGEEDEKVHPLELPELTTTPGNVGASLQLDLRELNLQPKDVVQFWIQATDNNSLTGPGTGRSEPLILRVASPEDRHMKVIADQMEVLEKLLLVLADYLENPAGERRPTAKGSYRQSVPQGLEPAERVRRYKALALAQKNEAQVLAMMATVAERMAEDPLMAPRDVTLFKSLYDQLYVLNRDGAETLNRLSSDARAGALGIADLQRVANWAAKAEDALEKGLVRLDNLLASQKMESVRRTADEIKDLKERLKELLERYRDERDPELKKAILREVQRLRQRMMELMARMQSQLKKLPQEHVNMEAIEQAQLESDAAKMGDNLQAIEDLLEQGDIDGALKALDDMTANLDKLTEGMDEQFANAQPEGLREMDKALSELMDQANDLEARQRELERKTRELQEAEDEREMERVERMLEKKTAELERLAAQQQSRLQQLTERDLARHDVEALDSAQEKARELQEMLESKDIDQALQQARSLREELRAIEFSLDLSQRYTDKKTDRGKDVRRSRQDVRSDLQPRSQRIVQQLEEIMDQARSQRGGPSNPAMQQLANEQKATEEQARQMRESVEKAAERFPMFEQQLGPPLDNARGEMGKAQRGLEGSRPQRALDHQRSALEQLRQLKDSMRNALQKQNQKGQQNGRGLKQDKVVIPEKDGRSQEQFREDVMQGMKQERLEDYESEIERYYESLMQ